MTQPATDILAAIDAAIGCQRCGEPLGESPSIDFCSELCQTRWRRALVLPLPTPRLFAETAPAELLTSHVRAMERLGPQIGLMIHTMGVALAEAFVEMTRGLGMLGAELVRAATADTAPPEDPKARALYLVRRRNTGPARRIRPPRTINARGNR